MIKKIISFFLLMAAAAVAGIFADQVVWPYFVQRPLFYQYRLEQAPVYVTEKQQTTIQENVALKSAIEKVAKAVAGVKSTTAKGVVLEGSGLVLTTDGLVVTFSNLLPAGAAFEIATDSGKSSFEIVKRDKTSGLALVKVAQGTLATASFYNLDNLRLGERVFLLGASAGNKRFANEGIVSSFSSQTIETTMVDLAQAAGAPVFDIEGNILGLASTNKSGRVSVIPISVIKIFSGL